MKISTTFKQLSPDLSVLPNVIKITRLAIPGLRSNARAQILPIKWRHERKQTQIFSTERAPFWAPSWPHLMGKTSFPWSGCIGPKPGNSQPCYFSNVGPTFFFESALRLMRRHLLRRAPEVAACTGKLAGHQSAWTAVTQVVAEQATLQEFITGVWVGAGHHQLIEKPEIERQFFMSRWATK